MLTLAELHALQQERLKELVDFAGSQTHLSKMINIPTSTIRGWVERGRISKEGADKVEHNSIFPKKFTVEYLRPDTKY